MPHDPASLTPARLLQLFKSHPRLLIAPAIIGAVLAAASTLVTPRDWRAEQGLLVRSDAAGYAEQRLGKFTDLSEMKTVQETLLELARSQSVVTEVLQEIDGRAPSRQAIADFRDKLRFDPPGGAEFGKTEVFYLGFLDPDRDRAVRIVEALAERLDARLNELRDHKAASLVAEVQRSADVAREQLHQQIERLAEFESSVGADLIELRHLTTPNGGSSELGQTALAIDADRRRSAEARQRNEALLVELRAAIDDPARILATPDALLESQPALRRLKNGLVDSQLNVARTRGARTANHPFVRAARHAQEAVQAELIRELPAAIAGVELELEVALRREADLAAQLQRLRARSAGLASKRSGYAELVAGVEGQTGVLESSLRQLADAKAARAGANSASLLSPIDLVETGAHPVGPGRTATTAAGGLAGLLLGAVLVVVLHAPRPDVPTATAAPIQVTSHHSAPESRSDWPVGAPQEARTDWAADSWGGAAWGIEQPQGGATQTIGV
ncbi:hypothetical protein [Botrimarina sp.]|uniref:hypothetical protein n=1 Tax=Botrimarina sp. TaxID=2795802 RepID=UPI0032EAD866